MESGTKRTETEAPDAADGDGGRSTATPSAETFEVHNPADGSLISSLPVHGPDEVRDVVTRARAAQPAWEALGHAGRYEWLGRWRDWMLSNGERIADVMEAETGKVRQDAGLEVPAVADALNFYGGNSARFLADEQVSAHNPLMKAKALKVVYRPYPVVGVIAPWNFPLLLTIGDAVPALAAGCAVVIKPSELTPLSPLELVRGWREEVGGPDVVQLVTGFGECGSARRRRGGLRPLHGFGRDRQEGDGARRRDPDPGQPRAGWQGPDDRARRRRPRAGGQRRRVGRAGELGPDLHVRRARLRRPSRSTTASSPRSPTACQAFARAPTGPPSHMTSEQ